eukprot:1690547-Alexandrium_andersonii.AAC.1
MQCNAVQCSAMQCNAVQCSAVQCSAMQCNAVQCSAMQCREHLMPERFWLDAGGCRSFAPGLPMPESIVRVGAAGATAL